MVFENLPTGYELQFLVDIGIALAAGFAIGAERESRGKPAGISTHCLVIGGTAIFTFLSSVIDPNSTSRIAAQVVSGIGFLGAGIILKSERDKKITNLTTAAYMVCSLHRDGYRLRILFHGSCSYRICCWSAKNTAYLKVDKERRRRVVKLNLWLPPLTL